jgi:glycerol-3-phosphate acyltransferase PlsY
MTALAILLGAYLIGAIPFGYLFVRLISGKDVRDSGSGNIGATNVLRTTGRLPAVLTLLFDIAKGFFAVWLADRLSTGDLLLMSLAALAVMAGHAFPVFLKFRGGKAVASFVGAYLYLTPLPLFAVLIVFVAVVAKTRHISAGSILGAGTFPFAVWMILHPPFYLAAAAAISGAFIIYRHKENIRRLREGTEHVFSFSGRKS